MGYPPFLKCLVVRRASLESGGQNLRRLRTLVALAKDTGLVPSASRLVTTFCHSRSRGPDALCWPIAAPGTQGMHIHTRRQNIYV